MYVYMYVCVYIYVSVYILYIMNKISLYTSLDIGTHPPHTHTHTYHKHLLKRWENKKHEEFTKIKK